MRSRIRLVLLEELSLCVLLLPGCWSFSEEQLNENRGVVSRVIQEYQRAKDIALKHMDMGLSVENPTVRNAERYSFQDMTGVIASRVEPGSQADHAGIRPGMLILEVNRRPIKHTTDFWITIDSKLNESGEALLLVTDGQWTTLLPLRWPSLSFSQNAATGAVKPTNTHPTSTVTLREETEEPPHVRMTSNPIVWTPDTRRCLWVLSVGVGQYKEPQVPPLPFARADAEQVRDWFVNLDAKGMTRDSLHILCDEQATRENLLSQIDWLRKQALPEDAVFVYFAGHGAPEIAADGTSVDAKYLVLYDTDPTQLFVTGFSLDELTRRLDAVKAKTQVVILEACYAGPVGQEILKKTPTADLEIRPRSIQKLGEKGGRIILSASSGRQMAIGSDDINGSLFTHYLLNAWGDGSTRLLSDGFDEAKYKVRRAANQLGSLQEPVKFGDQNVDVILKQK